MKVSIYILLLFGINFNQAEALSDYEKLIQKFESHSVKSLKNKKLHEDTKNKDLVNLGKILFFDKILSGNKDISCATCHFPSLGTSDLLPIPIGSGGKGLGLKRELAQGDFIPRNAPAAFNMAFDDFTTAMWDERISVARVKNKLILKTPEPSINGENPQSKEIVLQITSLAAAQALFPVTSHHEMRGRLGENDVADAKSNLEVWSVLTERLIGKNNGSEGGVERYRILFNKAYPEVKDFDEYNFGHVAKAIAAFEMQGFKANKSEFDDFLLGDKNALTRKQFRGASLFAGKGKCLSCHSGSHLTDFKSYSIGVPQLGPGKTEISSGMKYGEDYGLELMTLKKSDRYKFKTPTLRNVYYTGPWTHSGVYNDLLDFLKHHVDPDQGMKDFLNDPERYITNESYENFVELLDTNSERNLARVESQDPIIKTIELNQREIEDIYEFLKSLSDLSYYNEVRVPQTVPSGLPVDLE